MLGHFARMRGDTAEAKCAFQAVLRYAEKRGDRKARAQALNHLGILHMIAGEHSEAIGQMTEALALTREIGRHNEAVMITINLGIIHVRRGEVSKGRQRLAAALTRAEKMEFERGVQLAMTALVDLHLCTGDFRRALHLSGRLLHRAEEGEFADVVGIALSNRARAAMELGKIKDAERDVVKALSLTRADVHHGGLVDCLSVRAELDLRQDNPRAALKAAKEMMAVVEKHGETEHLANAQALVARAQLALGRRKAAAEMADAAVATAKRRQVPRDEGWAVWAKGLCARAARDESALRRAAKQSHQLGCEAGDAALVAAAEALGKDD
jgi:tetratricopeptide (TPR) repeat protein